MARVIAKCDVFISHAALDTALARELSSAFEASGLIVFEDSGIRTGSKWADSLRKALTESRALLLILPITGLSTWMIIEIGAARALSKPIYCIVQDLSTRDISPVLAGVSTYPPGRIGEVINKIKSQRKATKKRVSSR